MRRPVRTAPLTGVQFASRHGDELGLWAVSERAGDPPAPPSCTTAPAVRSTRARSSSPKACSSTDSPGPADPARSPTPPLPAAAGPVAGPVAGRTLDLLEPRRRGPRHPRSMKLTLRVATALGRRPGRSRWVLDRADALAGRCGSSAGGTRLGKTPKCCARPGSGRGW